MKKEFTKAVDKLISKALKLNINSTTSVAAFQPKVPTELSVLKNQKINDWQIGLKGCRKLYKKSEYLL